MTPELVKGLVFGTLVTVILVVGLMRKLVERVRHPSRDIRLNSFSGTFCWATGSKYVGGWQNGVQHGKGIFKVSRRVSIGRF